MAATGLSALCVGVMLGGGVLLFATGANAQDPPGNNGTIKVDDQPIDAIPNNNPHVGCEFRVDIYGYDQGVGDASVTFESQAPTKSVVVWSPATRLRTSAKTPLVAEPTSMLRRRTR